LNGLSVTVTLVLRVASKTWESSREAANRMLRIRLVLTIRPLWRQIALCTLISWREASCTQAPRAGASDRARRGARWNCHCVVHAGAITRISLDTT